MGSWAGAESRAAREEEGCHLVGLSGEGGEGRGGCCLGYGESTGLEHLEGKWGVYSCVRSTTLDRGSSKARLSKNNASPGQRWTGWSSGQGFGFLASRGDTAVTWKSEYRVQAVRAKGPCWLPHLGASGEVTVAGGRGRD